MDDVSTAFETRQKYKHFRILVIGRANAGKTTLLKQVCNTTDEPCIYDEQNNNLVRFMPDRRRCPSNRQISQTDKANLGGNCS
jgi:hypothetical protein